MVPAREVQSCIQQFVIGGCLRLVVMVAFIGLGD
jgi:hypothetical protein